MTTRYYVRQGTGEYLGGFDGAAPPDPGRAVEVSAPPAHALEQWNFGTEAWDDTPERRSAAARADLEATDGNAMRVLEDLIARLEADGLLDRTQLPQEAQDVLAQREALRREVQP